MMLYIQKKIVSFQHNDSDINLFKTRFKIDQFSFSDTDSQLLFDYRNGADLTSLVNSIFRFSLDHVNLEELNFFNKLDIQKRVIILMCLIQNKQFINSPVIFKQLVEDHLFFQKSDFTVDQWLDSVGSNDKRLQFYFKLQTDHSPIDADLFNNVQYYIPKILQGLVPSSFVTQSGINDFRVSSLSIIKALLKEELNLLNTLHSQIVEKTINGDFNGIYIERSLNNEFGIKFRKDTIPDLVKLDGIEEEKINTNPVLCELLRVYIDYFKYSRLENISLNKMHVQERIDILKNSLSAENGVFGFFEKIQNDLLACIKDQFGYDVDVTGVIYRVENVVVDYDPDERIQGNLHLDGLESNELMIGHSLFRSQSEDLNPKFTNVIPFGAPYDFQSNGSGNYPVTHSKKYQKESPNSTVVISSNSAHSAPKKPQDRIFVGIKVAVN